MSKKFTNEHEVFAYVGMNIHVIEYVGGMVIDKEYLGFMDKLGDLINSMEFASYDSLVLFRDAAIKGFILTKMRKVI